MKSAGGQLDGESDTVVLWPGKPMNTKLAVNGLLLCCLTRTSRSNEYKRLNTFHRKLQVLRSGKERPYWTYVDKCVKKKRKKKQVTKIDQKEK